MFFSCLLPFSFALATTLPPKKWMAGKNGAVYRLMMKLESGKSKSDARLSVAMLNHRLKTP